MSAGRTRAGPDQAPAPPAAVPGPGAALGVHLQYELKPGAQDGGQLDNPLFELLGAVHGCGSIGLAAQHLGRSYRYVWGTLREWEQTLAEPLIVWTQGQRARLTPFGERLLWAERRARARIQPHLEALRADLGRLLADARDPQVLTLALCASHDVALQVLQQHAARSGSLHLDLRVQGSVDSLRALSAGQCEVAGFHVPVQAVAAPLFSQAMKPLLAPGRHKLIGCYSRRQGLMVRHEDAARIQGLADLATPGDTGLRFVNRQIGSGTRLLMDHLLQAQAIDPSRIAGYAAHTESTHVAVAASVASGLADAGPGIEAAAIAFGLHFVPLVEEAYLLACHKPALANPAVLQLRTLLASPAWLATLRQLPGYAASAQAGQVLSMTTALPWWRYRTPRARSGAAVQRMAAEG
jgi:putative molybdopterin biosynthesis protein